MMKIELHKQALLLRKQGLGIRQIAKTLKISTSTASLWCRSIILTSEQENYLNSTGKKAELLRSYALMRHDQKILRDKKIFNLARKNFKKLSAQELFLVGLSLYWAEGFKTLKEGRVGFCNSDPRMIRFIIKWFRRSLQVPENEFVLRAEFNVEHKARQKEIEEYWSKLTGIPTIQFNRPYLQKAKHLRDYSKKGKYYGLLRIKIRKSSQMLIRLLGSIEGLSAC